MEKYERGRTLVIGATKIVLLTYITYRHLFALDGFTKFLVKEFNGNRCDICGKQFNPDSLQIHHKVQQQHGGGDNPENLVSLDQSCHAKADQFAEKGIDYEVAKYAIRNGLTPKQVLAQEYMSSNII